MIDWFEVVNIKEEANTGTVQADVLYNSVLNIYLDERDNREEENMRLRPNGFTEPTKKTKIYALTVTFDYFCLEYIVGEYNYRI